jgi:tetratricopeptide (TPR) repeat protein
MRHFKTALDISPKNSKAYFEMGRTYSEMGNTSEALVLFKNAIEEDARDYRSHLGMALILKQQGAVSEAILTMKKALEIEPDFIECIMHLGALYYELEDYKRALDCYQKAASADAAANDAVLQSGFCHFMLKQYAEAEEKFSRLVSFNDEKYSLTCYTQLAEIALIKNNHSQAAGYFEKACSLAPADAEIVKNLADAYFKLGRSSEAIDKYKTLLNISPKLGEAELKLGILYTRTSNYNDAMFYLSRSGEEFSENID